MRKVLQTRRLFGILAVLMTAFLLTACGSGDEDEDPTATSAPSGAQPTVAAETVETPGESPTPKDDAASVPENIDMSTATLDTTPVATAMIATPAEEIVIDPQAEAATPVVTAESDSTAVAPAAGAATPDGEVASPAAEVIPAAPPIGDGTTGAMVDGTPAPGEPAITATPIATPATPVEAASPAAPLVVTSCDVSEVPAFIGDQTTYRLTTDLNFRTGPGAECDLALEDPIGAFQAVDVIGGPVIREDDGSEWVQIRVLDTEGWVAFEFLEPVEQ